MPMAVFGSPQHRVIFKNMARMRCFRMKKRSTCLSAKTSEDMLKYAESKSGIFAFQRSKTAKTEQTVFTAM